MHKGKLTNINPPRITTEPLPSETLNYFSPVRVEQTSTETHIHLDERMPSALSYDVHFESKGFIEAVSITGFPIRDPIRFVLIPF